MLLFLTIAGIAAWFLWENCGFHGCPDVRQLRGYSPAEASIVLDRRGDELAKLYKIRRVVIPLGSLPPYVPAAFVAVEDRRFWEHDGVDWSRALGAAWANLRAMRIEEGFSTITMQLARNLFPDRLPAHERTLSRKLGEIRVAREIEARFDKSEILELYLNQIYFGNGAWGIEAAAAEYFGKPAAELTLAEAALLAGILRAPSRLNPRADPERAVALRNAVLRRMARQGWITAAAAAESEAAPLRLSRTRLEREALAAYFVEEVRQYLEARLGEALYTGGYRIHTTLDPRIQAVAERELGAQLRAIEAGRYGRFAGPAYAGVSADSLDGATPYLQGAVVVLDVQSGDVLALVGGRDFDASRFDRAVQARRQPGSAFKPFVYAAALAAGYPPTHILDDSPLRLVLANGAVWEPRNFGGRYAGPVTLRQALVQSRNVATVRLAQQVGLDAVLAAAQRLGLAGIPAVPSAAIGAGEVTLLELTAAYAAFATLGRRPDPRLVTSVTDRDGREVWRRPPESRRALDPAVAFVLTDILRDVVDRGTARAVRRVGYRGPAAGKTGTTNDATDVWFVGYTPRLAAGVWVGFDRRRTVLRGATGGEVAAPVWGRIMRRVAPADAEDWTPPAGVETRLIDPYGNVVAPWCPWVEGGRREYFLAGTAPPGGCGPRGLPPDTLPSDPDEAARWLDRMWRRLMGEEPDSGPVEPPRPEPDTAPPQDTIAPPDSTREEPPEQDRGGRRRPRLLGKPVPPGALPGGPLPNRRRPRRRARRWGRGGR